jgi:sugar lactone lactonase YvrE
MLFAEPEQELVRVAAASGDTLGESSVWNVDEQTLYWVDIRGHMLNAYSLETEICVHWLMPGKCCGVALASNGRLLVGIENALHLFNRDKGQLIHLVDIEPAAMNNRINEMRCDRRGRLSA